MQHLTRRSAILSAASLAASARQALAQAPEQPRIRFAVSGTAAVLYLPVILADRLGTFEKRGLAVEINDFASGAASAKALAGGSVEFATAGHELTFRMAQRGQDVVSVFELMNNYTVALAVRTDLASTITHVEGLRGKKIGVPGPGSSTQIFVQYLLAKAGIGVDEVTFVGVGTGSTVFAAVQNKQVDAVANVDPSMSRLQDAKMVSMLVDGRGEHNTRAVFGGHFPSVTTVATRAFIRRSPKTVQAAVTGLYEAQRWLRNATPEQVADAMPTEFYQGDRSLYIESVRRMQSSFSPSGYPSPEEIQRNLDYVRRGDPTFGDVNMDVSATFDASFAKAAALQLRT